MGKRTDGRDTQAKLLEAATEVFARRGYRDATITEICRAARANVASVNYHFGSKEQFYAAVWRRAFEHAMAVYPPYGGLTDDTPAEARLRAHIRSVLHKVLDRGQLGFYGQILLSELSHPTEAIRMVWRDAMGPLQERTRKVIRELLGPGASEEDVLFCAVSVMHQCLAFGFQGAPSRRILGELSDARVDALAEHIAVFSLAGIAAVRRRIRVSRRRS